MIDVTDTLSATLVAPTEAGANFTDVSIGGATYDISASIAADGSVATKKIIATPASIPAGWRLDITMAAPVTAGTSTGLKTFTDSNTAQEMVTGITNVAESGRGMTITVGPESAAIMPSYDAAGKAVTVVYTITAG